MQNERYTRVFTLKNNLYLEGMPVIIRAGALLKDNKANRVLAQIKLLNLMDKNIIAVRGRIKAFDVTDKFLDDNSFEFLDLDVKKGEDFADKIAVYLQNDNTRSFTVMIDEVIFSDKSQWQGSGTELAQISEPLRLEEKIENVEIREQYKIEVGGADFVPSEEADLWHCVCGVINKKGDEACYKCGKSYAELLEKLNYDDLEKRYKEIKEKEQLEEAKKAEVKKKKQRARKKYLGILIAIIVIAIASYFGYGQYVVYSDKAAAYENFSKFMEEGNFEDAVDSASEIVDFKDVNEKLYNLAESSWDKDREFSVSIFKMLGDYKDVRERLYNVAEDLLDKNRNEAISIFMSLGDYKDAKSHLVNVNNIISAGNTHTVGLKADGTVLAVGKNKYGQCNVGDWMGIVAVSAGGRHTVGLKVDGTVVAVGNNDYGQCDVGSWKDIAAITAGETYTVGLRNNGTVVAVGSNKCGECDVGSWKDIAAITAGGLHTVGLRSNGTVLAVGNNQYGECDLGDWKDIIDIAAGVGHIAGLNKDGSVVAVGNNYDGQCNVEKWEEVFSISAGDSTTVSLRRGRTLAVGNSYNNGLRKVATYDGIVAISVGGMHTVALREDGTVIAAGDNKYGQCNVEDWKNEMGYFK